MQVNRVNNNNCNYYNCNRQNAKPQQQKQNFGNGFIGNGLVSTLSFIENNGFITEFFVVDGLGMMGPRTLQAYLRNRKELGHLNYKAGAEEAIREFLTSPSMFLIPMGMVLLSGKMFGKATKVDVKTLKEFGKISKETLKKNPNTTNFKKDFYEETLSNIFQEHSKNADSKGLEVLTKTKLEISEKLEKLENTKLKNADKKKIKQSITEHFVHMNHLFGVSTNDPQKLKIYQTPKKSGELINDLLNYSQDKDIKKLSSKNNTEADKFLSKTLSDKEGVRKFMTTLSFATVGAFLYAIPLFYKRNKEFPGVDGLVQNPSTEQQNTQPPSKKGVIK